MVIPVWVLLLLVIIVLVNGGTMLIAAATAAIGAGIAGFILGYAAGYAEGRRERAYAEPPPRPKPTPKPRATLAAHWKTLGLKPGASEEEINERYRELAFKAHPDRGGTERAMRNLNLARDLARREARQRKE